jgi:hypothetical protein
MAAELKTINAQVQQSSEVPHASKNRGTSGNRTREVVDENRAQRGGSGRSFMSEELASI